MLATTPGLASDISKAVAGGGRLQCPSLAGLALPLRVHLFSFYSVPTQLVCGDAPSAPLSQPLQRHRRLSIYFWILQHGGSKRERLGVLRTVELFPTLSLHNLQSFTSCTSRIGTEMSFQHLPAEMLYVLVLSSVDISADSYRVGAGQGLCVAMNHVCKTCRRWIV